MKLENVALVLRKVDDAVNDLIEREAAQEKKFFETKEEALKWFIENDQNEPTAHTFVESEWFPDGLVWDQSLDLAWRFSKQEHAFFVSSGNEEHQKVTTTDFGVPPRTTQPTNEFFNIATGKTIRGGFDVDGKRRGTVGENVFLDTKHLESLIFAIKRGEPESFFEEERKVNGRPSLQKKALIKYHEVFPEGHGTLSWKEVIVRIRQKTDFEVSIKTVQRAIDHGRESIKTPKKLRQNPRQKFN